MILIKMSRIHSEWLDADRVVGSGVADARVREEPDDDGEEEEDEEEDDDDEAESDGYSE
jgi:hypothetical protein